MFTKPFKDERLLSIWNLSLWCLSSTMISIACWFAYSSHNDGVTANWWCCFKFLMRERDTYTIHNTSKITETHKKKVLGFDWMIFLWYRCLTRWIKREKWLGIVLHVKIPKNSHFKPAFHKIGNYSKLDFKSS